ncbi:MAG TPA: hypothetical protein VD837_08470 [Terriglobales bacterium]|nr:hypothetical protein [Terriglobales bacterium]
MNRLPDSLDSRTDELEQTREFEKVIDLLNSWCQYRTKLHLGIFHEFYMVRFEGWIIKDKPGYYFQPEGGNTSVTVVFFADPVRPYRIRDIGGRTSLTLGEISPTGSALMLTENVDELIEYAMHLRPIA